MHLSELSDFGPCQEQTLDQPGLIRVGLICTQIYAILLCAGIHAFVVSL